MKKKIHKIWGIGFVVVLAASLLLSAAPVSAGTLDWGTETIPSDTGNVLDQGTNVVDIAVSADGVMYAVTGTVNQTYKSTNGGETWSKMSEEFPFSPTFVAVALDDSDVLAIADSTNVTISTDGGATWGALGEVTNIVKMMDLAVSATDGTKNYVGVAGNTTSGAEVWYFNLGAAAPKWTSTASLAGFDGAASLLSDTAMAVGFSPNVASDKVMVAVTSLSGANTTFQIFSLSTSMWNESAAFDSYPVNVQHNSTNIADLETAAIVLSPDYLGSDDSMRVAFLGLNTASTAYGGVYRLKDTTDKDIADDKNVHSLDYDGTNLVAGATGSNRVWRSDNPLATDPDFSTASTLKRPALTTNTKVVVAWRGSDVVAGTSGSGSAFSVSADNGKSFNDISLVDVSSTLENLGNVVDVDVSPDGEVIYMLCSDNNSLSLWRKASSWQRVFAVAATTDDYIVRLAPDDPDVVYVAQTSGKIVYYSQEGGDTKWFIRTCKYDIGDMAIESSDVAYVAVDGASTVTKSTNSGFTWGTAEDTGTTGDIHMIRSLGEDDVIVGSNAGYVAYSTDGNDSWSTVKKQLNASGNAQATASGLADGDFVYAATDTASQRVERWEIGVSTGWKNLSAPLTDRKAYGIGLADGVLYVQTTCNATDSDTLRTLSPDTGEPSAGMWSVMSEDTQQFNAVPQSLKVSSGSVKLWSVDTVTPALYVYTDELTDVGPTLLGPRDGRKVEINPVSGVAYDVAFTWERPSKAKIYDLKIALDSGFLEGLGLASTTTSSTTDAEISEVIEGKYFMPDTTYYWRVRVNIDGPVKSAYSEVRSFTIGALPEALAPVIIEQPPAPIIQVPPAPSITITPPDIVLPPAPAPPPDIVIPPAPAPPAPITPAFIWAIIIIGAILVIAVVVLIVRTRRPV